MILQWRPLGYSLLVHLLIIISVLLSLFKYTEKTPKHETKMQITLASLSQPTVVSKAPATPQKIQQEVVVKPIKQVFSKTITRTQTAPLPLVSQSKPSIPSPAVPQHTPVAITPTPPAAVSKPSPVVAPPPAPAVNIEKEFLDAHLGEIRALLVKNLKYPRNAQRLKMQGEVRVSFRLKSDGSVENIEVIQSSGFEILDEDAKALIKNTAPQFPKPAKSISLSVPLAYLLR